MAIQFQCPQCAKTLKVGDENAGKQAKCPGCQTVVVIPNATVDENPFAQGFDAVGSAASPQPPVKPIKAGIDPRAAANPYATPSAAGGQRSSKPGNGGGGPQSVSFEQVFGYAWDVWKNNLGLLVGVLVATMGISFLLGFVGQIAAFGAAQIEPMLAVAILLVAQIVTTVVQIFLGIGQVKVCLELARTGRSEFGTLFTGGDRILPVLGFSILAGVAVSLGFVLLIVPGILLILFFWGSYYEVVDGRSKVMDSFSNAYEYCKLNVGTTFVIGLAGFGIVMLGFLALLIGVIFAVPLVMMMWAVAYLMMSGQISVQGR